MSPENVALCQRAIDLANSGQKQAAYEQFCTIRTNSNLGDISLLYGPEDVTLLYWIAFTTPSLEETQRAIDTIARIEPEHPKLQALQAYMARKEERRYQQQQEEQAKQVQQYRQRFEQQFEQRFGYAPPKGMFGAVLQCPYCHNVGPVRIEHRMSRDQVVAFVILLILFFPNMLDSSSERWRRVLCMCFLWHKVGIKIACTNDHGWAKPLCPCL